MGNSNSLPNNSEAVSQLNKLSSVINGLNKGAKAIRSHMTVASGAVRSGTYRVDPLQISQRIIRDCLRP
jgi:hypothetical protein